MQLWNRTKPAQLLLPVDPPNHRLAAGLTLYGKCSFDGRMEVAAILVGDVDGTVNSEINILDGGVIEGDVTATRVIVSGQVEGNIDATDVEVTRTGRVIGNIKTKTFRVQEGSSIQGSIHTPKPGTQAPVDTIAPRPLEAVATAA